MPLKSHGGQKVKTSTDKQRIILEALSSSRQADMHGHYRSFQSENSSLALRSERWDYISVGNQTRKASARSASLVTEKFVLKYPTKPQFTLQTSHPWKGRDNQPTAIERLLNMQIEGTETTLLKEIVIRTDSGLENLKGSKRDLICKRS